MAHASGNMVYTGESRWHIIYQLVINPSRYSISKVRENSSFYKFCKLFVVFLLNIPALNSVSIHILALSLI